ncbi:MAG: ATG16 family protein [Planctomycetes bacterium]|nr:ATG16 family protein [Planctomycetota bacterium]
MSTLTKVLILLVSIFSIFLGGIVATYVATAENFKKTAETNGQRLRSANEGRDSAQKGEEAAKKAADDLKQTLEGKINALEAQRVKLAADLEAAQRQNDQLVQKITNMGDVVQTANSTVKQQTGLFEEAQKKVQALEAERIEREKELTETSQTLVERVTIIAQLEDKVRQLTQENQDLGDRVNQYLVKFGKIATPPPTTVAPGTSSVRPTAPILPIGTGTRSIGLTGQITTVDLRSRLTEISIGTAAGVRQDMKFHVIRGDRWVADILILEVWPDKAVGLLDLIQPGLQPQTGDKVATNL